MLLCLAHMSHIHLTICMRGEIGGKGVHLCVNYQISNLRLFEQIETIIAVIVS